MISQRWLFETELRILSIHGLNSGVEYVLNKAEESMGVFDTFSACSSHDN